MNAGDIELQVFDKHFPPIEGEIGYYDGNLMLHESHVINLNQYRSAIVDTNDHTRVGCHYSMSYRTRLTRNIVCLGNIKKIYKITMNGLTVNYDTYVLHKAEELNRKKDKSNLENKTVLTTEKKQSWETLGLNIDDESKR